MLIHLPSFSLSPILGHGRILPPQNCVGSSWYPPGLRDVICCPHSSVAVLLCHLLHGHLRLRHHHCHRGLLYRAVRLGALHLRETQGRLCLFLSKPLVTEGNGDVLLIASEGGHVWKLACVHITTSTASLGFHRQAAGLGRSLFECVCFCVREGKRQTEKNLLIIL